MPKLPRISGDEKRGPLLAAFREWCFISELLHRVAHS